LREQVARLVSENTDIKKRLVDLEGKIIPLLMSGVGNRKRNEAKVPTTDMYARLNMTPKTSRCRSRSRGTDPDSVTSASKPMSTVSSTPVSTREIINPFVNMSMNANSGFGASNIIDSGGELEVLAVVVAIVVEMYTLVAYGPSRPAAGGGTQRVVFLHMLSMPFLAIH
jgi:hypothetical protein